MGRMADCECGGFILAYLVTGSSGICMPHFGNCPFQTIATYEMFKNKSIKKGAAPKQSLEKRQSPHFWNRTQIQGSTQSNASVVECQQESIILLWIKNLIDPT